MAVANTLIVTKKEEEKIKSSYERNEAEIQQDIAHIKEWLIKQTHLPQDEDDLRIRNMLLLNKCSLEKTKKKLDLYYSMKHLVPEFCDNREPLHPSVTTFMDIMTLFPLPKLTPECHRIYISSYKHDDTSKLNIITYYKLLFGIFDLRMMHDICLGMQIILNFKYLTIKHVALITPADFKRAYTYFQKAYSERVKGIHVVNIPPYAHSIVAFMSSIMSKKLANRIHIHKSYESLHKYILKEFLPNEYKGTLGPVNDLYENWQNYLFSKNDWIKEISLKKSDESKRIGKFLEADSFDMSGSFRKLNVD